MRRSGPASGTAARWAVPVALLVANRDHENWAERMNPWPVEEAIEEVHLPRPGHADLAGVMKFGHTDVRNVLERASARETAARVAAGGLAKAFLRPLGITVHSHVVQIGSVKAPPREIAGPQDFEHVDESPVRCLDEEASAAMVAEIDRARKANESLGGLFEVWAFGVLPGLGSHVSWDTRIDARIAWALMSIHAMKGVEIGDGFELGGRVGSAGPRRDLLERGARLHARHEPRRRDRGRHDDSGEPVVARVAMKPLPTLTKPLRSVDIESKRAGRGAAGAHRLLHRARGRRGGRGDAGAGARARLPGEVRRGRDGRRARGGVRLP